MTHKGPVHNLINAHRSDRSCRNGLLNSNTATNSLKAAIRPAAVLPQLNCTPLDIYTFRVNKR